MIEFLSTPIAPLLTDRPADPHAAGLLRNLCGVGPHEPLYELIASRIRIRATSDCVVTLAGTVFRPEQGNMIVLHRGEILELTPYSKGYRDYLIAQLPEGSKSRKWLSASHFEDMDTGVLRVAKGPEFTEGCLDGEFIVDSRSNRMGVRLNRVRPREFALPELITSPVGWGTIQLPPDGHPIILMPDCQSTGGYPRIGWVVPQDLRILAQLKPGASLRFKTLV